MTRDRRLVLAVACALLAAAAAVPAPMAAQVVVGLRGDWKDLETWSHYLEESRENALGLGLQVSGEDGTILLAFEGRLSTRSPRTPPRDISVQLYAPPTVNPNVIRKPTAIFVVRDDTGKRTTLDFSPRLRVDNLAVGAPIESGVARITAGDYLALANAAALNAQLLGFDAAFRPDQLDAMKAFAEKLYLGPTQR